MKRSTTLILLLTLLLLVVGAAFFLLDFRFQKAEMATDSVASTYSYDVGQEGTLPLEQALDLYVKVPDSLKEPLAAALEDTLSANPYVRNVNVSEGEPAPAPESVLIVEIDDSAALLWTPFFTRSSFSANVYYATDGEVAWIDEEVVELTSATEPGLIVRYEAEYTCQGSAYGLISGPGYMNNLAGDLATMINDSLVSSLESQQRS